MAVTQITRPVLPLDERMVYLDLRHVFTEGNSTMRDPEWINATISIYLRDPRVARLATVYGLDALCQAAQRLLWEGVFENVCIAQHRFPELFSLSAAEFVKHTATEMERMKRQAAQFYRERRQNYKTLNTTSCKIPIKTAAGNEKTISAAPCKATAQGQQARLYSPLIFPLRIQRLFLSQAQDTLERACYEFLQRHMPDILAATEWDCPEACELNVVVGKLRDRKMELLAGRRYVSPKRIETLLGDISQIRHKVVHRVKTSAQSLESSLRDAEHFASLLEHFESVHVLAKIRRIVVTAMDEVEENARRLRMRLDVGLQQTQARRLDIDRLDDQTIADIKREEEIFVAQIIQKLENMARRQAWHSHEEEHNKAGLYARDDTCVLHSVRKGDEGVFFSPHEPDCENGAEAKSDLKPVDMVSLCSWVGL